MPRTQIAPQSDQQSTRDLLARFAQNWPEVVSPESDIVLCLLRLNAIARAGTETVLKQHKLTPAAFEVLVTLRSMPAGQALTPTELYRANLLSSGGLTKVLHTLENRKFISIVSNKSDGRSKKIKLSVAGQKLVEGAGLEVASQDRDLFDGNMGRAKLHQLRDMLLDVLTGVERDQRLQTTDKEHAA